MSSNGDTTAIIQARMSSTRLPGKSLMEICGRPMLQLMLERVSAAKAITVVVATSSDPSDDPIEQLCNALDVPVVRGDLYDVLSRYIQALDAFHPKVAIRMTGDCPLTDVALLDCAMKYFSELKQNKKSAVGVSNHLSDRRDPLGYGAEVFWPDSLRELHRLGLDAHEREHVTLGFIHRNRYQSYHCSSKDYSSLRWTVDTPQDFEYVSALFHTLGTDVTFKEAVQWSLQNPHPAGP